MERGSEGGKGDGNDGGDGGSADNDVEGGGRGNESI
jgi:hypothetical protein